MNDTLLPNKMTKSYLLESDPYLKTSSKTSTFALNSDNDSVFRGGLSSAWNSNNHSSDLIADRPTVKPLAMHNVPSNVPPIAYINGNSVRPVRCRHYSQQQTVFHNNHHHSNSSEKLNSGIKVAAGDMHHYAQSNENGVNEFGGNAGDSFAAADHQIGSPEPKNGSLSSKPLGNKAKVQSSDSGQSVPTTTTTRQQQSSKSPSRQLPSSHSDYVTTNTDENESSIYSHLYENTDQVVEHLAKRIEGVLRSAKENRRLTCTELLIPQILTTQIASNVIEMSECEPCGLRGCQLYICMEDSTSGQSGVAANKHHKSSSSDHSHQGNSNHSIASRLLGEVVLDRSVVPTFEVFLTLKRAHPSWLESIENKLMSNLLGKERIVLCETYLIHKNRLYKTPSSPTF